MKKMKNRWFFWSIFVVSLLLGLWVYFTTPNVPVPVHLNMRGEVDGYGSKFMGTLLFPLVILVVGLLLIYLEKIDPFRENVKRSRKAIDATLDIMAAFMLFFQIAFSWLIKTNSNKLDTAVLYVGMGIMFILIGNYLPTIKRNFFVGVRTPWTLASDSVWRSTHRLAGWAFVLLGIWTILVGILKLNFWLWFAVFIVVIIYISIVYPFVKFKKEQSESRLG